MSEIKEFIKTIHNKKKYKYDFDNKNKHKLLKKDDIISFKKLADDMHITDSPYIIDIDKNDSQNPYKIPYKQHREIVTEEIFQTDVINTNDIDYVYIDAQFHAHKLIVNSIDEFYPDADRINSLYNIFNGTIFGLSWMYPLEMKIIFDSLYHLNALMREICIYWSYPNMSNKKLDAQAKYMDFIIHQKSAELCSYKFNQFFVYFHQFFHIEYMYRHYQGYDKYNLNYNYIFYELLRYFIMYMFDDDESLFWRFMDDENHGITIHYSLSDDISIPLKEQFYCRYGNTFQYQSINNDEKCLQKQNEYMQLMVQFKSFLRMFCIKPYKQYIQPTFSRLHCYHSSYEHDDNNTEYRKDVSILYDESSDFIDKYRIIFPVTHQLLHDAYSNKIINHSAFSIIF